MNIRVVTCAALAALSLSGTIIPVANAATHGRPASAHRAGPYDNTGNGPQESGMEGGGG
nr:hypothetical protein [uncultured Rhodopila sp.]